MAREARNRILARWSPSQGRSSSRDLNTGYSIITPDIVPQHNPRHREQVREQEHHVDDDRDGGVQGGILKHRSAGDSAWSNG